MICFKEYERTDCVFITYGTPLIFDKDGLEVSESTIGNPYLHTGREYDAETGLYYHRARYRSSTFGTWLSKDPIGFEGGFNLYTYVKNNPINFKDPTGKLSVIDLIIKLVKYYLNKSLPKSLGRKAGFDIPSLGGEGESCGESCEKVGEKNNNCKTICIYQCKDGTILKKEGPCSNTYYKHQGYYTGSE